MKLLLIWRAGAVALCVACGAPVKGAAMRLHFASNDNFRPDGTYLPGKSGFNLADVTSAKQLASLPTGVKGLAWIGRCGGVDSGFLETMRGYAAQPNLFGFYLMDDPQPNFRLFGHCPAERLKQESDWIHGNLPGVKTFIVLLNLGSSKAPVFGESYKPSNSHVDLFGVSPYPCRTELIRCDFEMIDRYVAAAGVSGVSRDRIVPLYQAFGGGDWFDDGGGKYALPTSAQEREILARWRRLVPVAVFDYAYSWGSQRGDLALRNASNLQAVFVQFNHAD